MKQVEFWYWKMRDMLGRVRRSVCEMTEADALARDPDAVRIPGTLVVRNCPENADEVAAAAPTNRHFK